MKNFSYRASELPYAASRLELIEGTAEHYRRFARWHYRDNGSLSPYAAIYCLAQPRDFPGINAGTIAAVIVYTMPTPGCPGRDIATGGYFAELPRSDRLAELNRTVRRISRVIVEPRYRGCGLAADIVRRTMPLLNVPFIEAMSVMGHFNPFFEKAGMSAYLPPQSRENATLLEALEYLGINEDIFTEPQKLAEKLAALPNTDKAYIDRHIRKLPGFKRLYHKTNHPTGHDAIAHLLCTKLSVRPVYYAWMNPDHKI